MEVNSMSRYYVLRNAKFSHHKETAYGLGISFMSACILGIIAMMMTYLAISVILGTFIIQCFELVGIKGSNDKQINYCWNISQLCVIIFVLFVMIYHNGQLVVDTIDHYCVHLKDVMKDKVKSS